MKSDGTTLPRASDVLGSSVAAAVERSVRYLEVSGLGFRHSGFRALGLGVSLTAGQQTTDSSSPTSAQVRPRHSKTPHAVEG